MIEVDPPEAIGALAPARGAELVGRLIHVHNRVLGATTLTFERKQSALEGAARLRARSGGASTATAHATPQRRTEKTLPILSF